MSDCDYCVYNADGICTGAGGLYEGNEIPSLYDTDCDIYIDNTMVGASTPDYIEDFF